MRRLAGGGSWGGVEKLIFEWFERIDFEQCRVTLVVSKGPSEKFKNNVKARKLPVELVELPFQMNGYFSKRFSEMYSFLKGLQPTSVVFLQGAFTDFGFAYILAAYLLTGGKIFMHENLEAGLPPEKTT